jgi:hypothetical protein
MSGPSAIVTSKITNGIMIGQFAGVATRPKGEIMLALDVASHDPSIKVAS